MANLKYPVSGAISAGTTATHVSATISRLLLGATNTPGRVFWLREAWAFATNAGGAAVVVGDISSGVTSIGATVSATFTRMVIHVTGPTGGHSVVKIPEPGMCFKRGYGPVAACHVTGATEVRDAGGMGYEM